MSDILIKGFDFPEDCSKCPLRKVPQMRDDICVISGCRVHNYPERPSWCYLHEVKPHGDLIDRDEAMAEFADRMCVDDILDGVYEPAVEVLRSAPTVLEAST